MTVTMNLTRIALVASTILGWAVGAICLDTSRRLPPLGEERLATATGMNRNKIVDYIKTCADLQAQRYVCAVTDVGCTADNVGTRCVSCNSEGTNVQIYIDFVDPPQPPGVYINDPLVLCGPEIMGTCAMIDGVPTCDDENPTGNNCPTITEYFNQPPS